MLMFEASSFENLVKSEQLLRSGGFRDCGDRGQKHLWGPFINQNDSSSCLSSKF